MVRSATAQRPALSRTDRALRPIDLVHLAKQCMGDAALEHEILRLFDTTMETYFARLSGATSGEDVRQALHSIKGAAGGVGAFVVADLAKAAEADLHASGALGGEAIADLCHAMEEVRAFIASVSSRELA